MPRLAVLTSGGDAPGMNAAIRAVVRTAIGRGWEAAGVLHGFQGLLDDTLRPLGARDVGGVMHQGGTMLGSARAPAFKTDAGQIKALTTLAKHDITGLVVIGGNGTQTGAHALSARGVRVVGVASTIDNDLIGSDVTIGADTALNVALEAIDRLRTTASSHKRAVIVEVMGRDCGYLALMAGIAGGAEAILLPETAVDPAALAGELRAAFDRGKLHALVVVAEGATWNGRRLAEYFETNSELGFDPRLTILGHVQRGGVPTAFDRLLATRLGMAAAERLVTGLHGVLVGVQGGDIITTPLADVVGRTKAPDLMMLEQARVLAL